MHSSDDQGRVYLNFKFNDPPGRGSYARVRPCKSYSENAFLPLNLLPYFEGWFRQTQKDGFDDMPFDSYFMLKQVILQLSSAMIYSVYDWAVDM